MTERKHTLLPVTTKPIIMRHINYATCLIVFLAVAGSYPMVESSSLLDSIPGANFLIGQTMKSLKWFSELIENSPKSRAIFSLMDSIPSHDPDTKRNVSEVIRSRGFEAEEYNVVTRDGYILTIQRIINPLVDPAHRSKMKPIIMQHGLMSSSIDWVINSVKVRPEHWPREKNDEISSCPVAIDDIMTQESTQLPEVEGSLMKYTNFLGGYQPRYFILRKGVLIYDLTKDNLHRNCRGAIDISKVKSVRLLGDTGFQIMTNSVSWSLRAFSHSDRKLWIEAIYRAGALLSNEGNDTEVSRSSTGSNLNSQSNPEKVNLSDDVKYLPPATEATSSGTTDTSESSLNDDITDESGENSLTDSQENPNSLGFFMANRGYDVFLANSRGNIYGQKHTKLSSWEPKFWDFTFDEQIEYDLRDTISFVQNLTGHKKIGYVGHSQGTAMMFGLLSDKPEYSEIVEPFVALAPVTYVSNTISPAKYFAVYTPIAQHINMWFATSNLAVRYLAPIVCSPQVIRKEICQNIVFLGTGFNEDELDFSRISAYLAHMPSGTSVKNIAHYGQEVLSGRFSHFDHGILTNMAKYGTRHAPDYQLARIRSKSIALFVAENDWLAAPKDVAKLRHDLTVEPFAVFNMTEKNDKFNHIDYVYAKHAGVWVNPHVYDVFEHFRARDEAASTNA